MHLLKFSNSTYSEIRIHKVYVGIWFVDTYNIYQHKHSTQQIYWRDEPFSGVVYNTRTRMFAVFSKYIIMPFLVVKKKSSIAYAYICSTLLSHYVPHTRTTASSRYEVYVELLCWYVICKIAYPDTNTQLLFTQQTKTTVQEYHGQGLRCLVAALLCGI